MIKSDTKMKRNSFFPSQVSSRQYDDYTGDPPYNMVIFCNILTEDTP